MAALWVAREHLSSMAYMVGVYGSILTMVGPSFVRIFIMWQGAASESYEGCPSSFVSLALYKEAMVADCLEASSSPGVWNIQFVSTAND